MRALWTTRVGGPEVLEVRETPDPRPKAGEVRVRVMAAGLNFAEVMARRGLYPDSPPLPTILGYEAAGVVDALGPGVETPPLGTRVIVLSRFSAHAELVCVPFHQVIPMPNAMSFEIGAAIPVAYITAWHMLFRVAHVRPTDRVLVHMAAGGVGQAVLQLCRTIEGVEVFGTASASKHAFLRELGCKHAIDYRAEDWADAVRRITGGEGLDVVLDPLGGEDTRKAYDLLRPMGRLVVYGFANMTKGGDVEKTVPQFNPFSLMAKNRTLAGVNIIHLWGLAGILEHELAELVNLWVKGAIAPRVDEVFTFEKAGEAHRRIESRQNVGKIVLVP